MNENVHKIFEYPFIRLECGDAQYLSNKAKAFKKLYFKSIIFNAFYSPLYFLRRAKKNKYLFITAELFKDILPEVKKEAIVFCFASDLQVIIKGFYNFEPIYHYYPESYKLFLNNPLFNSEDAQNIVKKIKKVFKKIGPEYLILRDDSFFFNRLLIHCARELGIKSICIQHGLFQEKSDFRIVNGHYADYMFVWGNAQSLIYDRNSYNLKKIKILGYPYKKLCNRNQINKNKICILGQPWERYNDKLGNKKKDIFQKIIAELGKEFVEIVYKPHPSEDNKNYYPDNASIYNKSIEKALKKFDVFISLTTTALLEASLCGKIAIQIYDEDFRTDRFEDKGYSYSIDSSKIEYIKEYLNKISEPFAVSEDVITRSANPGKRFLELLNELKSSRGYNA